MKLSAVLAWIIGIAVLFAGTLIGAASYVFGMTFLVVAVALTVRTFFGPTLMERHHEKLRKASWPMTPIKQRLLALAAVVINDEEEERLEGIRRSGYVGDIEVTGRDLTTGLPITGSVETSDLWPPDDLVREPAPR